MSSRKKIAFGWALILIGGLVLLIGLWAIGAYIWGIIDILDEADQSWIFWGLIFLFIGVVATFIGSGAIAGGWSMARAAKLEKKANSREAD